MAGQKLNPVAWTEGMLLRPQHLQQQELYLYHRPAGTGVEVRQHAQVLGVSRQLLAQLAQLAGVDGRVPGIARQARRPGPIQQYL